MYVHQEKDKCCGCTACMAVCPKKAIHMKADLEGFLYPEIDESVCIGCNLCRAVCDFTNNIKLDNKSLPIAYAAKQKSLEERAASQSGGMFSVLSDYFLKLDGCIYGAGYDAEWNVVHQRATNLKERDILRGSKYVQSNMKNNFDKVIDDLQRHRYVLFSGTHCQCAGLKRLLELKKINTDKLLLVDLICHGVPSPAVYQLFKGFMLKKHPGTITKFVFRNKNKFGWRSTIESTVIDGQEYDTALYRDLFYGENALRPSCYECPYKSIIHNTDITIGDCWGIENWAPEFDDGKGVSLALINTEKGQKYFDNIMESIDYKKTNIKNCLQPCLEHPVPRPKTREQFWQDLNTKNFEYILTHYTSNYGWKSSVKNYLRKIYHALR